MNIDSIKINPTGHMPKHKQKYGLEGRDKCTNADLCEYRSIGKYNGSFTGKNVAAVLNSRFTHADGGFVDTIAKLCDAHTVIAQNLVALVLAVGLRPLTIMSLPGKEKDKGDKIYASAHSIASGLIGFGFSCLVMYPLGQAYKKIAKEVDNLQKGAKYLEESTKVGFDQSKKEFKTFVDSAKEFFKVDDLKNIKESKVYKELCEHSKKFYGIDDLKNLKDSKVFTRLAKTLSKENGSRVLGMSPDVFVFGVVKAILTIKLIKPILKYGFGIEKSSHKQAQQPQEQTQVRMTGKPDIAKFVGGLK